MSPEEIAVALVNRHVSVLDPERYEIIEAIKLAIAEARNFSLTLDSYDGRIKKMRDALTAKDDALLEVCNLLREDYFENWEEALDAADAARKIIV